MKGGRMRQVVSDGLEVCGDGAVVYGVVVAFGAAAGFIVGGILAIAFAWALDRRRR